MSDEEYDFGLDGAGRKKLNKAKENEKKAKQNEKAEADAKRKSEGPSDNKGTYRGEDKDNAQKVGPNGHKPGWTPGGKDKKKEEEEEEEGKGNN